MRPIWTGALSFGLINIPVRVYGGSEEHDLEFDMLHKVDLSPIRYARICKADGKEIPYSEIVKGYEFKKGEYIVIDEDDFKRANPKKTKSIEIRSFTFLDEIQSEYFDKPYLLEPDKGAAKAYSLLREALKKSKKVAIVNYVFRNRERLGVVKASDNALVLNQMRYDSELRKTDNLTIPAEQKSTSKELDVALKLIDQLTEPFQPHKYKDSYVEELRSLIEAKIKGKKPAQKGKAPQYTPNSDLMKLLKESLRQSTSSTQPPTKKTPHKIKEEPKKKPRPKRTK